MRMNTRKDGMRGGGSIKIRLPDEGECSAGGRCVLVVTLSTSRFRSVIRSNSSHAGELPPNAGFPPPEAGRTRQHGDCAWACVAGEDMLARGGSPEEAGGSGSQDLRWSSVGKGLAVMGGRGPMIVCGKSAERGQ